MDQKAYGWADLAADTRGMGIFANLRKNRSDYDESDDWLLDLQEDVDPRELELLGLPTSKASPEHQDHQPEDRPVSDPTPPAPGFGPEFANPPGGQLTEVGWHLPDLALRPEQPAAQQIEPLVSFTEPEAPHYQPIDFEQSNAGRALQGWAASALSMPPPPPDTFSEEVDDHTERPDSPDGPRGPGAEVLLEILGLFPGASWQHVRAAHAELIEGHRSDQFSDEAEAELAEEIRREMNSAYAALRLLVVR